MSRLSVNLNKVALVRNTRPLGIPDVVRFGRIALEAGAAGLTVHPRPDERHIRPHDVRDLARLLKDWPDREFNIEGNPFHNMMALVEEVRPNQCTLVPDDPAATTSDHGWNLLRDGERLGPLIERIHALGARVSLFMDADADAMRVAAALGADRVELYTEPYARAFGTPAIAESLRTYAAAAKAAVEAGLGVNAGHDLNLPNLGPFLREVPRVIEVSIGHALTADALEMGMASAVKAYLAVIADTAGSVT